MLFRSMSSSLSGSGSPSGTRGFTPGQGGRYGIGGVGLADDYNVYDEVLEYLLGEGYTEEESNLIMVELVTEGGLQDFVRQVQRVTGIGKVGPVQVAKNIGAKGLKDTLAALSSLPSGGPSTAAPARTPTALTHSPAPQVRVSTQQIRTEIGRAHV